MLLNPVYATIVDGDTPMLTGKKTTASTRATDDLTQGYFCICKLKLLCLGLQ
jgi:hypothetical protein